MLLTKYFCDRCKKLIPDDLDIFRLSIKYDVFNRAENTGYISKVHYSELCPSCFAKINDIVCEIEKNREDLEGKDDDTQGNT